MIVGKEGLSEKLSCQVIVEKVETLSGETSYRVAAGKMDDSSVETSFQVIVGKAEPCRQMGKVGGVGISFQVIEGEVSGENSS